MERYLIAVMLLCATTVLAEASQTKKQKVPLHKHPTLLKMLDKNNELRSRQGLEPHRMSPRLTKAAQDHAQFMAQTHIFSHDATGGHTYRAQKFDYNGSVRENIAMGYQTIEQTFTGWQQSGGHWASIVSNTIDAGFGYAIAEDGTQYWVGMYGYGSDVAGAP